MAQDRQGNPVTGSAASAAALDAVIHDYYAWTGDILGALGAGTRDDPGFILGHAATATILLLGGFRGDHPAVVETLATADALAAKATARERAHLAIARSIAAGGLRAAAQLSERILADHPTDALALRYATDLYYYLGDSTGIRDVVTRALPSWRESDPVFGFILGRQAFGLEESGDLDQAQAVGQRALAINPRDAWATHAVAHVHEMRGDTEGGIRFLETTRQDWQVGKWLAVHNGWHLALFLIDAGRGDEVLAKYDSFVQPRLKDNFILDLIDAASLLWRLELAGVDAGARWTEVAAIAAARIGEHVLAFNDLHVALGTVGGKDKAATEKLLASIDRYLVAGVGDNHTVTTEVGRALVTGMDAFGAGDYRRVIDVLLPLRGATIRIGGSHAQRDVVDETLIAAAMRAGEWSVARTILGERATQRPTPRMVSAAQRDFGTAWRDVVTLTLEQKERFARDGYLVIDDFKSADEVAALRRRAGEIVEAFDPHEAGIFSTNDQTRTNDDYFLDSGDKIRCFFEEEAFDAQGQLKQGNALSINKIGHAMHDLDPVFDRFSRDPRLAEIVVDLGVAQPLLWQSMYIFKQPSIGGEVRWHQDATFFDTVPSTVTAFWFALEDADRQNGCLWVEPGGHRGPLRERFLRDDRTVRIETVSTTSWPTERTAVPVEVKAGALVCFSGMLPHYSAPNRSAVSRHAYTLHVTDAGATYSSRNWLQRGADLPVRGFA